MGGSEALPLVTSTTKVWPAWLALLAAIAVAPARTARSGDVETPALQAAIQAAAEHGEAFWRQIATAEPRPIVGCRALMSCALALCEARVHPERLDRLLELTRQMQDQDPRSKNWGNLRWCWRDAAVTDTNAVEFCMQDALLMRIRHRGWLPPGAGKQLDDLLRLGVEGCLRHRVPTDYTNIAILNSGNLIVLGELLDRPDAAREGYRRLDALCLQTAAWGVHEFCSPTYYGTDLNGLLLVYAYARNQRQRRQAEALLQLFWTDIAANWVPAAGRLGGCHSRSYDYLHGLGGLDWHLWIHGWLPSPAAGRAERREPWTDQWQPSPQLAEMARRQFPRLVRQHWGLLPVESRTHMIYRDVSLSCCGAGYGSQDTTLAVDLPGGRQQARCYFIPDGRDDPYGRKTIETGAARHPKALHLQPFWAGAQRSCDALGLAIYRPGDVSGEDAADVQSHFVLRRPDAAWLNGQRLALPAGTASKPSEVPIPAGAALVLRYAGAAVAVRVPWIRVWSAEPTKARLVDDGNAWNCLRLTIDHGRPSDAHPSALGPVGAVFWVRVGSELTDEAGFDAWRKQFETSEVHVMEISRKKARIEVQGKDGPLSITAETPWDRSSRVRIVPRPYQGPLEVDGKELGRPLLLAAEPLVSLPTGVGPLACVHVPAGKAFFWEAESGLVLPGMAVGEDNAASGGRYVGQESSPLGQPGGSVTWSLRIEKAGRYWLWARVRAADPARPSAARGSFTVRVIGDDGAVTPASTWAPQSLTTWQWQPLTFEGQKSPTVLDLSPGEYRLQLQTRRSGAMIDRLALTGDPQDRP